MTTKELIKQTTIPFSKWKKLTEKEKQEWDNKKLNLEKQWKLWLFKDEEVENNPKREKCFAMAWEMGHSTGYEEVEYHFRDLVELIK